MGDPKKKSRAIAKAMERESPSSNPVSPVGQPRLVRLEVDLIETRRYTKTIDFPEDFANRVIGKLWQTITEGDCRRLIA